MATPKRTAILNAIVAQLSTILTSGGYNFNVGEASINFKNSEQVEKDKWPFLCLQVGPSRYAPLTQSEYTAGRSFDDLDGWMIGIIGYIEFNQSAGTFVEVTEKFHQDILNCMAADPQFGLSSYVINSYLEVVFDPLVITGEQGQNSGDAIVHLVYKIKYDFAKGAA